MNPLFPVTGRNSMLPSGCGLFFFPVFFCDSFLVGIPLLIHAIVIISRPLTRNYLSFFALSLCLPDIGSRVCFVRFFCLSVSLSQCLCELVLRWRRQLLLIPRIPTMTPRRRQPSKPPLPRRPKSHEEGLTLPQDLRKCTSSMCPEWSPTYLSL